MLRRAPELLRMHTCIRARVACCAAAGSAHSCACRCVVQTGGLQRIADDISRAVKANCGKKAIVMSHSYGATVMASIFQKAEFAKWRYVCMQLRQSCALLRLFSTAWAHM